MLSVSVLVCFTQKPAGFKFELMLCWSVRGLPEQALMTAKGQVEKIRRSTLKNIKIQKYMEIVFYFSVEFDSMSKFPFSVQVFFSIPLLTSDGFVTKVRP